MQYAQLVHNNKTIFITTQELASIEDAEGESNIKLQIKDLPPAEISDNVSLKVVYGQLLVNDLSDYDSAVIELSDNANKSIGIVNGPVCYNLTLHGIDVFNDMSLVSEGRVTFAALISVPDLLLYDQLKDNLRVAFLRDSEIDNPIEDVLNRKGLILFEEAEIKSYCLLTVKNWRKYIKKNALKSTVKKIMAVKPTQR